MRTSVNILTLTILKNSIHSVTLVDSYKHNESLWSIIQLNSKLLDEWTVLDKNTYQATISSTPTLKPSTTQEPTRSSARQTVLLFKQNTNTTLNIKRWSSQSHAKPMDTQNSLLGISLHPRDKRPVSPTRTQTQAPPTQPGNLETPLVQAHP